MRGICGMRQSYLSNGSFVFSMRSCKNGFMNRCSFQVISAVAEHTEARKPYTSSNEYIIRVVSFVKSHLAANAGKYPRFSLVMQETGVSVYMARKIIKEIKSGNLDARGRDGMDVSHEANAEKVSFNELVSHDDRDEAPKQSDLPIFSEMGVQAQGDAHSAVCNVDANLALRDVPDPVSEGHENTRAIVSCEVERMNKEDVHSAVRRIEQMQVPDHTISLHVEEAREEIHANCSLQHTENGLQTDGNSAVLKAVSLRPEPQQQKAAGSRRVNLSTVMGLENDLSWKKTLSSIAPDRKAGQCKTEAKLYCMSWASTHPRSILMNLSREQVKDSFRKCGKIERIYFSRGNSISQVFVYFKTEKGLCEALKMKPSFLKGEEVTVEHVSTAGIEEPKQAFNGTFQALAGVTSRAPNLKRTVMVPTNTRADGMADTFSSILSILGSDLSKESSLLCNLNRVQNTVSIEKCPVNFPLDTLKDFFSLYGEVLNCFFGARQADEQTCYVEFKNEEIKKKALEISNFTIHGHLFKIRDDEFPGTLVVRLENINSKTSTEKIINVCQNYGDVRNAMERSANVVDVQFGPGEENKIGEILGRLAEVTIDTQKWQPRLLCHGFRRFVDLQSTCELCLQRQQDNLKLLSLAKQLLVHLEGMCVRDRAI